MDAEGAHVAQRDRQTLVQKAAPLTLLQTGGAIEVPVVDKGRPLSVGLREKKHHAVDVLLGEVDDRQQNCRTRKVGYVLIAAKIAGAFPRKVQTVIEHADLALLGI